MAIFADLEVLSGADTQICPSGGADQRGHRVLTQRGEVPYPLGSSGVPDAAVICVGGLPVALAAADLLGDL